MCSCEYFALPNYRCACGQKDKFTWRGCASRSLIFIQTTGNLQRREEDTICFPVQGNSWQRRRRTGWTEENPPFPPVRVTLVHASHAHPCHFFLDITFY